ncbi:MAG: hypothetical protein IKF38_05650 [Clostridia bacterium]|nr:hypothetical protein [Clostridia bacterium]
MLYPQKINAKKTDFIIKIAILISFVVGVLLVVINRFTTPDIKWAGYCNAGIIYVWITVIYALNKNINIASHLFIQMMALSALCVYIDLRLGFEAWSINLAIPIIVIIINIIMLILSITSYNNYIRYAFFQLLIVIASMVPIFLVYENLINDKTLSIVATSMSGVNLLFSLIFHSKDIKAEIVRKFHM